MLAAIEGVGYWVIRSARALSNIRKVQRDRAEKEPRQMSMRRVRWWVVTGLAACGSLLHEEPLLLRGLLA